MLILIKMLRQSTLFLVLAFPANPGRSDSIFARLSRILAK